jgi:hypothetical protein
MTILSVDNFFYVKGCCLKGNALFCLIISEEFEFLNTSGGLKSLLA